MEYKHWRIMVGQRKAGWYYLVTDLPNKTFRAIHGPFAGPESATESAKLLVDVLKENIAW